MADHDETVALPPSPSSVATPTSHSTPNGFAPGALLAGRYRIVSLLGKGGMGEVYRADDLTLGQSVALKFLPLGAATERFRNEVKIARQVSHPNVCRVYDVGEIEGQWFLSMEYVDGEDLGSLLRRIGRLPADKALEISRKLCAGLAAAHEKGVLHRDLKPGNVMLDGRGQVLLTDFGLAAAAGEVEGAEILSGTPAYMAPEQLAGREVTIRSDIYSLGLVIYELFTGKRPYESDTLAGLQKARSETAPASMTSMVRDVDPVVERIILRCLDPDPGKRPPSAISVAAGLPGGDPLAAALAAGETPSPQMIAAAGEGRGLKPVWAFALLAAVIAGILTNAAVESRNNVVNLMGAEYSGDVLKVKARDTLNTLGYTTRPNDTAFGFDWNRGYIDWMAEHAKPVDWNRVLREQPTGLRFWYRESPYPFRGEAVHSDLLTPGIVTETDPPMVLSGTINVELDATGRLYQLDAVPPQRTEAPPAEGNWDALFTAAGLDRSRFQEASPQWTFLATSDQRKAWTGTWPGTNRPVRVEAAMFLGKPVAFRLISDWTKPTRMPPVDSSEGFGRTVVIVALVSLVTFGSAILSRRNLKTGKADYKGATRLGTFVFFLLMVIWACQVHLNASAGLIGSFFIALATSAGWAIALWMTYIALEPFVRRHWPQAIISWSSITVRNWRDPIVGRDVLAGAALGVSWRLIDRIIDLVAPDGIPAMMDDSMLEGFRSALGAVFTKGYYGVRSALIMFFLFFLTRLLVRRQAIAAPVFVLVFSFTAAVSNEHFWLAWGATLPIYALIAVAIVRLGLVALAAAVFVADGALLTGALNASGWYAWNAAFAVAVLAALGIWACKTALGGQQVWKTDDLG